MERAWYTMLVTIDDKKKGDPYQLEKSQGDMLVNLKYAEALKGDPTGGLENVAKAAAEAQVEMIKNAVTETLKTVLPEYLKQVTTQSGELFAKGISIVGLKSEEEKKFSFADQLRQIGTVNNPSMPTDHQIKAANILKDGYKSEFRAWSSNEKASVHVENTGTLGGYGIKPEYSSELYKIAIEQTVFASKARQVPMGTNEHKYPKLDQTGTQTTGQTGYLGGVVLSWSNEATNANQTNAKIKQGSLKAEELKGYTILANELLQDVNTFSLEDEVKTLFGEAIGYYIDLASLINMGVGAPIGIVSAPATVQVQRLKAGAYLDYTDLLRMGKGMLPGSYSSNRCMWIFHQSLFDSVYGLTDPSGSLVVQPYYSSNGGPMGVSLTQAIMGKPFAFTEKISTFGTIGDALLVDPIGYLLGKRMELEIMASPHAAFLANEMVYRFIARVGGQPILDKPFTLLDGVTQVSHFVALK